MRVCVVIQSFSPVVGGAQLQLERMAPELARRGAELTILTKRHEERPSRERIEGATVRRIGVRGASPLSSLLFVCSALLHIALHRRRYDALHAYGALSEGVVAHGAALLGLPVLIRILRAGYWGDLDRLRSKPAGAWRLRQLARRASFVALSQESQDELEALGVPEERIFRIPNGVDLDQFRPAGGEERLALKGGLPLAAGNVLAVWAGRVWPEKRVELIVESVERTPGLAAVIVGEGPERARLEALVESLAVVDRVHFAGKHADVARFLRAGDLFLLPSRSEGMSNSLLEAMACGLPCLATDVSGMRELLGEGRGVLVEPEDEEAWFAQVAALCADPDRRAQIGERARTFVRDQYSLAIAAERTFEAYARLAGDAGGVSQRSRQSSN